MNTDTITRWLAAPANLPDEAAIKALTQSSPWFVPGRLMEAAQLHRKEGFSARTLSRMHLYGTEWVSVYQLLEASGTAQPEPSVTSAPEPAPAPAPVAATASEAPAETRPQTPPQPMDDLPAQQGTPHPHPEVPLIQPLYTEDYFRYQGLGEPAAHEAPPTATGSDDPKTLMVVMSFAEWLSHFKVKSEREQEEERDKRALRSMWQQEKLAAALEDEPEEIPEDVFEMAVSSITREDDLATESLAEILEKQEKWSAAAEMYRKLGLRNPAKSAYFASRAEAAKKRAK